MPSPLRTASVAHHSPGPHEVAGAWKDGVLAPARNPGAEQARGVFLAGLPLVLRGEVVIETEPLTPRGVIDRVLDDKAAPLWNADLETGSSAVFLVELARRLLVLGHLDQPDQPRADRLLRLKEIDPDCEWEGLALARATVAIELENSELLRKVVARHAYYKAWAAGANSNGKSPLDHWMTLLMADETAQCLLANGLVRSERSDPEVALLLQALAADAETTWPAGPIRTLGALGAALREPDNPEALPALQRHSAWPGWTDEDHWPIRLAAGLPGLQARLTDRMAEALEVADRKLWRQDRLDPQLRDAWPPLQGFCFGRRTMTSPPATNKDRP